jgi:hypothetical protein
LLLPGQGARLHDRAGNTPADVERIAADFGKGAARGGAEPQQQRGRPGIVVLPPRGPAAADGILGKLEVSGAPRQHCIGRDAQFAGTAPEHGAR